MSAATEPESRQQVKRAIAQWLVGLLRRQNPGSDPLLTLYEIGVKQGMLTEQLLIACPLRLVVRGVDRWAPAGVDDDYRTIGDPAACAPQDEHTAWFHEAQDRTCAFGNGRVQLIQADSLDAAGFVGAGTLSGVYLDADHSYAGRLADLLAWAPKVESGGIVAGGLWNSRYGGDCCERAVREYLRGLGHGVDVEFGPEKTWAFVML